MDVSIASPPTIIGYPCDSSNFVIVAIQNKEAINAEKKLLKIKGSYNNLNKKMNFKLSSSGITP